MRFIHSILQPVTTPGADGDVVIDLPVNPLSVILIGLEPLNNTATIGNYRYLEGLLSALDNVRVTVQGASVVDMRGVEAAMLAMLYHGASCWQANAATTDNDRRSLVVPIILGRHAWDPDECLPETKKGEAVLTLSLDIADTGFDALRYWVETVELPEAKPTYCERKIQVVRTFAATGQNDVDLPLGNVLRALLLFNTTGFTGATPAPTGADYQFLVDNQQTHYTSTFWQGLRAVAGCYGRSQPVDFNHRHSYDGAAAGESQTKEPELVPSMDDNYALMDFDPTGDDTYSVDTKGAGRVHLKVNAGTADGFRAVVVERLPAGRITRSGLAVG